jgi:hypothetical protein
MQYKVKRMVQGLVLTVQDLLGQKPKKTNYMKPILATIGIIILGTGVYLGYRWYVVSREQKAQKLLSEYVQDYALAQKSGNQEEFQRIEALFAYGYNQHRSSNLAPYFLAMQAEAQLKQNKQDEALATLHTLVATLPSSSPMAPLFKTKHALLSLDNKDEAIRDAGLQELVAVARDNQFGYNDMALFYLGRYYWSQNNVQEAKKIWQELVDMRSLDQSSAPSPWAQEAQQKLKQLTH